MYTCGECSERLYRFLDDEVEEVERVAIMLHLDGCPDCLIRFRIEGTILQMVGAAARQPQCPDALRLRIALARRSDTAPTPEASDTSPGAGH